MNGPDPSTSPWGEPASAAAAPVRTTPARSPRSGNGSGRRNGAAPSPHRAAAASTLFTGRQPPRAKRATQLVERTILVRLIPRTGPFARIRAAIALAVIAVVVGLVVAGAFSLIIWGIASAVHHAASN